eukprot:9503861-Pyramimonas_sp.AAC.2
MGGWGAPTMRPTQIWTTLPQACISQLQKTKKDAADTIGRASCDDVELTDGTVAGPSSDVYPMEFGTTLALLCVGCLTTHARRAAADLSLPNDGD